MRNQQITVPEAGIIQYPNAVAFMYSRQPIIVQCGNTGNYEVTVAVTCSTNGYTTYTEKRRLLKGRAEFDISRIMQLLARDTDKLLQGLDYTNGSCLAEAFSIQVMIGNNAVLDTTCQALHGALDAGETYGAKTTRRLFLNYPQSINMWIEFFGTFNVKLGDTWYTPEYLKGGPDCREVNFMGFIDGSVLTALKNGLPVDGAISWLYGIKKGVATHQQLADITLVPDNSPAGCGTYLRWLNRRGEVSYWRFDNLQIETAGAVEDTFSRYYAGDPTEPVQSVYTNEDKRNYEETRRQTLTATGVSDEEFDDLCSLQVSPVVEMLGADGASWYRVNVDAGTQARKNRRNTPKLHDFEISITLPKRNTVKL